MQKIPIRIDKAKFIKASKIVGILFGLLFLLCGSPWLRSGLNPIALFWTPNISTIDGSLFCTTRETPEFRIQASGAGQYRFLIYPKEALQNASKSKRQDPDAFKICLIPAIESEAAIDVLQHAKPLQSFQGWLHALDFTRTNASIKLSSPLPAGDYLILAETINPFFPGKPDRTAKCFRVTDLGLIIKEASERTVIQAVDLVTLTPRAGVEVHMTSENKFLSSRQALTGTDGITVIKRHPTDHKGQEYYYAQLGQNYAASLPHTYDSSWIQFGIYDHENTTPLSQIGHEPEQYNLYFATDRSAYRLGQTLFFKGTTRSPKPTGLASIGSNIPVTVEIVDPAGDKVWSKNFLTNKFGAVNGSMHLSEAAKTGTYIVTFRYPDGIERRKYFKVIEYRKSEFEVKVVPISPVTVAGDKLKVKVQANYYFGEPVANATVHYTVSTGERDRSFTETPEAERKFFDGANSEDSYFYDSEVPSAFITQGQVVTDQKGAAIIELSTEDTTKKKSTKDSQDTPSDQIYVVNADVTDASLKTVSSTGSALVVLADFSLQVRTDKPRYKDNEPIEVNVVASPNSGVSVANRKLSVVFRHKNYSMFFGESKPYEEEASTQTASTDAEGKASFKLTAKPGFDYTSIVARSVDDKGRKVLTEKFVEFEARRHGEESPTLDEPISLTMDREYYRPGDIARVLLTAPIENINGTSAFMSVDGATIYDYKSLKMTGSSQYIDVPIRSSYAPNVYITVTLLDRRHNPYTISKAIKVYPSDKLFKVSVESNKPRYEPGDSATFTIKATRLDGLPAADAEVNLAVVDESIFAISPDRTRDIQQSLYGNTENTVETFATFHGFTPLSQLSAELWIWNQCLWSIPIAILVPPVIFLIAMRAPPAILWVCRGGGALAFATLYVCVWGTKTVFSALGPLLEKPESASVGPSTRTNFQDTILWSPSLTTDANGVARASVKMPDNLTTWRATACAVDMDGGAGSGTEKVLSSKNLIARLSLPRFYCQGDSAFIKGVVHNYSGNAQPLRVTLTCSPQFKVNDKLVRDVTVADGGTQEIVWPVTISDTSAGTTTVKLAAVGQVSDALAIKIPIRPYGFTDFRAVNGVIKEDNGTRTLPTGLEADDDAQSAQYELALSASQIGPVLGNFSTLINYPYGCTEQTMSRLIPSVVAMRLQKDLNVAMPTGARERFEEVHSASMVKLADLQRPDGGWGWWTTDAHSDPYLTAYVLDGMFQLRQVGYKVDQKLLDRGLTRLQNYGDSLILHPWDRETATDHARILYVLSLYGQKPTAAAVAWQVGQSLFAPPEALSCLTLAFHNANNEKAALIAYGQLLTLANESDEFLDWDHTPGMLARLKLRDASTYTYRFTGTETTALALQAVLAMEPNNEERRSKIRSWILLQRGKDGWDNTKTTAQVFLSLLADDLVTHKNLATNFKVRTTGTSSHKFATDVSTSSLIKELVFNQKNMYEPETTCKFTGDNLPSKMVLSKQGKGNLFYNGLLTYQRKLKPGESLETKSMPKGLKLMRDFSGLAMMKGNDKNKTTDASNDAAKGDRSADLLRLKRIPLPEHIKAGGMLLMRVRVSSPVAVPYVMIEVPLPSGSEVISKDASELQLLTGEEDSKEPHPTRWWWSHQDVLDDRIVFFVTDFPAGTCELTTALRMEMPGHHNINPAQFQGMYTNKVRAYSQPNQINVEP